MLLIRLSFIIWDRIGLTWASVENVERFWNVMKSIVCLWKHKPATQPHSMSKQHFIVWESVKTNRKLFRANKLLWFKSKTIWFYKSPVHCSHDWRPKRNDADEYSDQYVRETWEKWFFGLYFDVTIQLVWRWFSIVPSSMDTAKVRWKNWPEHTESAYGVFTWM